ncbi:MAG: protein kinase domain-containing protein [Gemmatimonadales bacterium]
MAGPHSPDASAPAPLRVQDELVERLRHTTAGEYDILGELGQGGMATVFLAHDLSLDRKVAVKVMLPSMVYGEGMVQRFKREARTAASLSHPNIIPVYAVRESEGLLFFVMKLIQGTPLEAVLRELGQLPLPMIEAILGQVGGALGYAHRRGVVHRDVKPGNILIDEDGWAVVTDFGIAKVAETEGLTLTGMAVGTPTYMSPEQALGGEITGASDQYSLGVVAYEMLGGQPPFRGSNPMSLMYAHCHDHPPPLGDLRPDCPTSLREAVERMLAKEPAARWPTMDDALSAIGLRVLAPDDPNRSQLIEIAKSGATRKLVTQVQTPRSPVPLRRKSGEVPHAPSPAAPRRWVWAAGAALALAGIVGAVVLLQPDRSSPPDAPAPPAVDPAPPQAAPAPSSGSRTRDDGPERRPAAPQSAPATAGTGGAAQSQPQPSPAPPPAAQAESARTTQRVDSPARVVAPPPAPPPAALETALTDPPATNPRLEVEEAIQSYARALEAGDLTQALRLFPGMPRDLRQGLEAFYGSGGSMRPRWTVTDVSVTDATATAQIRGSNQVRTARGASEERVSLRARLERTAFGWRLTALVN